MKSSVSIISILLALVVVLFGYLLLSTVGSSKDGFQEGAIPNSNNQTNGQKARKSGEGTSSA